MRALALLAALTMAVSCSSSSKRRPPPPKKAAPPPPEEASPPPPVEEESTSRVLVSQIRGVETENIPSSVLERMSSQLQSELGPRVRALDVSDAGGACVSEGCRLEVAQNQQADQLLHNRLIQYEQNCLLISVLFDVPAGHSAWAASEAFTCEEEAFKAAVSSIASAFSNRDSKAPTKATFAVVPIQHRLKDIVWASESLTEYLSTRCAQAGFKMLPAGVVTENLTRGPPHKACGTKKCQVKLALNSNAQHAVSTSVRRRGKTCSVVTSVYNVQTRRKTTSARAKGGCEAEDIAGSIQKLVAKLKPPKEAVADNEAEEEGGETTADAGTSESGSNRVVKPKEEGESEEEAEDPPEETKEEAEEEAEAPPPENEEDVPDESELSDDPELEEEAEDLKTP